MLLSADKQIMAPIRALIVDDSSVMRKIIDRTLRQAGLELETVYEASTGSEALELLQNRQVHLILSDINMPSMDGLEFLNQLRSRNLATNTPIVMITTESSAEHVKKAILAGARGYIRKPFTVDQMKEHVVPLVTTS
jgi:two-component system chemotaxis response regulator CheY